MDKRFTLFMLLAVGAWLLNIAIVAWINPPQPVVEVGAEQAADPQGDRAEVPAEGDADEDDADEDNVEDGDVADDEADAGGEDGAAEEGQPADAKNPERWLTLGSLNPASPYRMLVLLSSRGAAVDRIELNADFQDLEQDKQAGYLGPLATGDADGGGALVRVVGPGTPAALAGLQEGDVVRAVGGTAIATGAEFEALLAATVPEHALTLDIERGGQKQELTVALAHPPLKLVKREWHEDEQLLDPASLLLTLRKLGSEELSRGDAGELAGLNLRDGNWEVRTVDQQRGLVEFVWTLEKRGVEVVKRYRLAAVAAPGEEPPAAVDGVPPPPTVAYHLDLDVEIRNIGGKPIDVAYRLDGPTGLPTEGWWYGAKIGRDGVLFSSPIGTRDVAVLYAGEDNETTIIGCPHIADEDFLDETTTRDTPLTFMGVDAQYFAAIMLPQKAAPTDKWHVDSRAIRAGPMPEEKARRKLLNTSCRLDSVAVTLKPEEKLAHTYRLFGGPKKPSILAEYQLDSLVYYGWFGTVSNALLAVLHFFYGLVGNYGLAIVMLTVLVRGCMFPISRKQALGAQKMSELQPELKKINEKHKNSPQEKQKATQELFRKHNYNPFGGCLLVFLQLPIFMGLYRGLMIDPELRQAPLIPGLQWASNLAAPDMLFRWDHLIPFSFLTSETGFLGPYFNLLPVFTVALFLWQQKLFMPPPADEQQAMQQKMMKYMMVFMAVMFFKVASGLCIYFIASSLWGIAERKILPKMQHPAAAPVAAPPAAAPARAIGNGNGAANKRKKQPRKN